MASTFTVKLDDAWFIACTSAELAQKPLAMTLQGTPLVLFRGANGSPAALLDRCPHRNVPLSEGRVRDGLLECAYHGWRFDGAGACRFVPGLVADKEPTLRSRAADAYPTRELDGYVWVYTTAGATAKSEPYRFPHLDDYTVVRREFIVNSTLHAAAENALDVPHTAFLHGGLFRTAQKKNEIEVVVRRYSAHAEAEYLGEPRPSGLLGRLLAPQGGTVQHWDRFLLPCIAQVEYRLGASHVLSTTALTPLEEFKTRLFAVVAFKLPIPGFLAKPFVAPVASRILAQDAVMLAKQTATIQRFGGERYTSTELDVLGHEILRLLKQAGGHEVASAEVQEHRIKMRT